MNELQKALNNGTITEFHDHYQLNKTWVITEPVTLDKTLQMPKNSVIGQAKPSGFLVKPAK